MKKKKSAGLKVETRGWPPWHYRRQKNAHLQKGPRTRNKPGEPARLGHARFAGATVEKSEQMSGVSFRVGGKQGGTHAAPFTTSSYEGALTFASPTRRKELA